MALPALLRKLFKNSGSGSELNDGIVSKTISNQDWSNAYNYPVGAIARGSNNILYYSVAQSGPGTSAGAKNPVSAGASYWVSLDIASLESSVNSALAGKVSTSTYNSGMATKVALDGSNASSIGKTLSTYMAHAASIAVESKVSITLPYVAPADGWMLMHGRANYQGSDTRLFFSYNGEESCVYKIYWDGSSNSVDSAVLLPISKGVRAYLASGTLLYSEFYYANGTKP